MAILVAVRPFRPRLLPYATGVVALLVCGSALQSLSAGHFVFFGQGSQAGTVKPVLGGYTFLSPEDAGARGGYLDHLITFPVDFMRERITSLVTLLCPWPLGIQKRSMGTWIIIATSDLTAYALALWALVASRRLVPPLKSQTWLLAAPMLGLTLFYGLLFSQVRYRWPFMPFLLCYFSIVWASVAGARSSATTLRQARLENH